jgi:hypothetical protein
VRVGDEDLSGSQQPRGSKVVVVSEVKQQGSFRPPNFHIHTRITENIVDQIAGEGGVHGIIMY